MVYPATPFAPRRACISAMAARTGPAEFSTTFTPSTSLLWRICGEITFTTARDPGSAVSAASVTSSAPGTKRWPGAATPIA